MSEEEGPDTMPAPQVSSKGSEEQKMMVADLQQKLKKSQDEVQRHMLEAQIRCLADL